MMTDVNSTLNKKKHLALLVKIHVQSPTEGATGCSVLFFNAICNVILDYSMTVSQNDGVINS